MTINESFVFSTRWADVSGKIDVSISNESATKCWVECEVSMCTTASTNLNTWADFYYSILGGPLDALGEITSGHKGITFREKDKWYLLDKAGFWLTSNPIESRAFKVGFKDRTSRPNSLGLIVGNSYYTREAEYTLDAYASLPREPELDILDNNNNTFTIKRTPKGTSDSPYSEFNGRHCYVYDCHSYFNLNKNYTPTSAIGTFDGSFNNTTEEWKIDVSTLSPKRILLDNSTYSDGFKVEAIGYTMGKVDRQSAYSYASNPSTPVIKSIKYYAPPNCTNISVVLNDLNGKKLTPKSSIKASWSGALAGNTNSPISKFAIAIFINDKPLYISNNTVDSSPMDNRYTLIDGDKSECNISDIINRYLGQFGNPTKLKKGDVIKVGINAYYLCGDGTTKLWYEDYNSPPTHNATITLESSGIMRMKANDYSWKEGQAYIKTYDGWKEATSIYVKTTTGWKESV